MGFSILLRDRRQTRRAEAEKVASWTRQVLSITRTDQGHSWNITVKLVNNSDSLFLQPKIIVWSKSTRQMRRTTRLAAIQPDEVKPKRTRRFLYGRTFVGLDDSGTLLSPKVSVEETIISEYTPRFLDLSVHFLDLNGVWWRRNLETGALRKNSRRNRIMP